MARQWPLGTFHGKRMNRNAATGRITWLKRLFRLIRSPATDATKNKAGRSGVDQRLRNQQSQQRPRFAEGLEDRRLLSVSPIRFAPAQFYNDVSGSVAVGTFVNGGLPDLVGVSGTYNTVHILLNNGDGTFHSGQAFYVPGVREAAVGDFSHNGNEDVAVITPVSDVSGADSLIYIFKGNGDGTFATPPQKIGLAYNANDIAVADLNGDGYPDILITVAHRLIVLINKGDGTFNRPVPYNAGAQYSGQLVVGDFNGDGIPDVAITRTGSNQIAILIGQKGASNLGDGTFGKPEIYRLGTNPHAIAVGDFNHDGIDDLVVANSDFRQPAVAVLMGNGDGTFAKPLGLYGGNFVDGVAVGDFNGDGNLDIASVSFTSFLRAYAGNGDGTFQPERQFGSSSYGQHLVTADFSGDGLADVAVATGGGIRVLLALPSSAPVTTPTTLTATIGRGGPASITYHDVGGFKTTISLSGPGSATIQFSGANLSLNSAGNQLVGDPASVESIAATGTSTGTTLSITVPVNRNGRPNIGSISTDGSLGSIAAAQTNLIGNLSVAGTLGSATFFNVSHGTITLGSGGVPVNFNIANATDETLASSQPIGLLSVGQWFSDTGTPTQISAPAISRITAPSQFESNLTVGTGGLSTVYVRNIPQGTWNIAGRVGSIRASRDIQLTLTAPSIASLYAGNTLNNDVLHIAGNIGSITAGSMFNSSIYAGVGPLPPGQRLPTSLSELASSSSIGSVTLRSRFQTVSFVNSSLSAATIGRVVAGVVAFSNAGQVQGIAAESVGAFSGADLLTKKIFSLNHPLTLASLISGRIDPADFVLTIL